MYMMSAYRSSGRTAVLLALGVPDSRGANYLKDVDTVNLERRIVHTCYSWVIAQHGTARWLIIGRDKPNLLYVRRSSTSKSWQQRPCVPQEAREHCTQAGADAQEKAVEASDECHQH